MIIVDAHSDTISRILDCNENLYKNTGHMDIERLSGKNGRVQFFAAFIDPEYRNSAMKRAINIIDKLYEQIEIYNDHMMLCHNYNEILNTIDAGKISAIISIECGSALEGDISVLRTFYRLGVRSICLTWNHENEIACGVLDSSPGKGLTKFGREVVLEMNRLGMLVDLSHISEESFYDVLSVTKSPVLVSHSNAKKICNHVRNLSDEQIQAVKDINGVIGINFYPNFLNDSGKACISDIIKHIEHIISIAGDSNIGIGADFDGIECLPCGITGTDSTELLLNELLKLNYNEDTVEKIMGKNMLRIITEVMR
ncbi:MAG TPA: dipeptidase [Clostridia bacterium]